MVNVTVMLTFLSLQVSALAYSQQINIEVKNKPFVDVLTTIRKQTGYSYMISSENLKYANPVTLTLKSATLETTLKTLFSNQPFNYTIEGKLIIIQRKSAEKKNTEKQTSLRQLDIMGFVADSTGIPLPGADISVVGQNSLRAATDGDGRFVIRNVPNQGSILVRLIGYESRTVPYSGVNLVIHLKQAISGLDEVHVIAYGTTSKRLTTGNIGGIKAIDIERTPVSNALLTLQGRTPGVFISQSSGMAGAGVVVRIQGQNSIANGNDPFYVVDGVPYSSQVLPTALDVLGRSGNSPMPTGAGNPFSFINPSDIESIEVLKDADATAIYGSRAANGAILITTKRGKAGQTKVDLTVQNGVGQITRKSKLLNTEQYLDFRKEAYKNDGLTIPSPSGSKNATNYDLTTFDPHRYTDWQKELLGGSAHYTDVQASISGGSAQTTFRLNGGYHRETTVFPGNFSDVKGSVGISINHSSGNDKFKVQFSSNYLNDNNQLPTFDLTQTALRTAPNAPALRNADGSLNWARIASGADSVSTWTNPLSYFENTYQIKTSNLVSSVNLSYAIFRGLILKTSLGYTDMITSEVATFPLSAYKPELRASNSRAATYGNARMKTWIIEPQLTYDFNVSSGHASFLVGSTFQRNDNDQQQLYGTGYNSDQVLKNYTSASVLAPGLSRVLSIYKYNALFGKFNYNWEDKYIINLTTRRDGSSRFGSANRFHNFGAIGAAWLFSNENFIKDGVSFISFGKLRASYGSTGSDQIGDYAYLNEYEIITPETPYQGFTGLQPRKIDNPYLQWELTKKLQVGLDLGVLKDRILFGLNYFNNRSSNQLLAYALPYQSGFDGVLLNFPATVENKGWEFTLNTINLKQRDLSWNTSINLTANKNKLVAFPGLASSTYANTLVIGYPVDLNKLYNLTDVNAETGLYEYKAADGTIVTAPDALKDRTIYFSPAPRFYGGVQNNITYKGLELSFLVQFVNQKARNFLLGTQSRLGTMGNAPVEVLRRWQNKGNVTDIQKFSTRTLLFTPLGSNLSYSDASYVRLKNVSLSYTLPIKWIKITHLQRCRIFAQGQNLFTRTKYIGLDPEIASSNSLPPLRVFTFGLQATF